MPKFVFEVFKAGTKKWLLECKCGHKRDLWDAGGVKGGDTEQFTLAKCLKCAKIRWHKKRKKTDEELLQFQ